MTATHHKLKLDGAEQTTADHFPERPVLIVDDDCDWLFYMQSLLRRVGATNVRTLSDPTNAIDLVREFEPSAILLDLLMGARDGERLLRDIREILPRTPVVIVSCVEDRERAIACMRHGADDYIAKPPSPERLTDALNRAFAKSLGSDARLDAIAAAAPGPGRGDLELPDLLQGLRTLPPLKEVGDILIDEAMRRSNGVIKDAADMLGVSPQAICNRRRRRRTAQEP